MYRLQYVLYRPNKKQLRYFSEQLETLKNRTYINLATHAIDTGEEFTDINNMTLLKQILLKSLNKYVRKELLRTYGRITHIKPTKNMTHVQSARVLETYFIRNNTDGSGISTKNRKNNHVRIKFYHEQTKYEHAV